MTGPRPPLSRKYRALAILLLPGNALLTWLLRHGRAPKAFALLETTGRHTGSPRYTCVGNGLTGETFWLVAAHGGQADWVRNIAADPAVRVLVHRAWRRGAAALLPNDDPVARSHTLPHQWDAAIGRMIATTPLTIRIDLETDP